MIIPTTKQIKVEFSDKEHNFNPSFLHDAVIIYETLKGATFYPSVSEDGVISWTNDHELENPKPVNIKGEDGFSPTVSVEKIEGGYRVVITDKDGEKTFNVIDNVELKEISTAVDTLEGKIKIVEDKPAYNITETQISNWNNEVGAKTLAGTKTTAAEVKNQIEAYGYATADELSKAIEAARTDYDNKDAVVLGEAQTYTNAVKTEIIEDAASKYETKGTAQNVIDGLKLSETYEPIGAENRAVAAAEGKVNALASNVYTKKELESFLTWGSF